MTVGTTLQSLTTTMISSGESPVLTKRLSSSSCRSLSEIISPSRPTPTRSSSSSASVPFSDSETSGMVTVEGLAHANIRLSARQYKTPTFAHQLLQLLALLRVPSWHEPGIESDHVRIHKVSGSLTNAVFFVTRPSSRTLLLRIYGPSSGSLISRPRELHTLHVLSSQYRIGPRVYGTFQNGRVEEFFDSVTLTASDMRVEKFSRWIGARMAELHSVDIDVVEGKGWKIAANKNVRSWLPPAREVLALPSVSDTVREKLGLDDFFDDWERYMQWLDEFEKKEGASKRVFCHNDAQYGNLLMLTSHKKGAPEHHRIIVVDFEYASPNPAAFDIANHFHEWTANYHTATPHILDPTRYPTIEQRQNYYRAYLSHTTSTSLRAGISVDHIAERDFQKLDSQVRAWSPASHAMWAVWGIVQAREDLETNSREPEFDYIGYAQCRMDGFRREIRSLGL
ncbi:hypothetical protein JAAARDRAFT_37882 [Jaapia argillacea MUCL 33604]|uniref:Choline kinase N-terminal domain-containing protein n=1 Tax=Jaapia argillacea MUCL 33604 TaxID=933084 RepID=A0A067PIP1_9AGAM|nr:hypothetical protein JAAARDRAFT_37882 [Jaapia argillacea MUCL 33604]